MKLLPFATTLFAVTLAACGSGSDAPVNDSPVLEQAAVEEVVNPFQPVEEMQGAISEPPVTVVQEPAQEVIQPVINDPAPQPEPAPEPEPIPQQLILSPVNTNETFREEWRGDANPSPFVIVDIRIQWEPMQGHTYGLVVGDNLQQENISSPFNYRLEYPGLLETFNYSQIPNLWIRMCVPEGCEDMSAVYRQPVVAPEPAPLQPIGLDDPEFCPSQFFNNHALTDDAEAFEGLDIEVLEVSDAGQCYLSVLGTNPNDTQNTLELTFTMSRAPNSIASSYILNGLSYDYASDPASPPTDATMRSCLLVIEACDDMLNSL